MNILVINGSPKGNYSCTLQTCLYLQKKFPSDSFTFYNVASKIKQIENDFSEAKALIESADLLLFSYPVYTFIVPSQLHRFIELMKLNFVSTPLSDKYATQITTSKHFYDYTAHTFIQENCQDLGLKFIKGLSADMDDLTKESGQKDALSFFSFVKWSVANDVFETFNSSSTTPNHVVIDESRLQPILTSSKHSIALVADLTPEDTQLKSMIKAFSAINASNNITFINIHEFPFKGGCISCFNCAVDGTCIYKDGFSDMLREKIQTCDSIVLAFSIKDHSMGSIFKTYDDRQFCNGHRTVTMGKPFGYLISGNYSQEANLQLIINGRAEVGGNYLAGVACDEFDPNSEIFAMSKRLDFAMDNHYVQPANFLGVGGMKIFRDLIWVMQGLMKADHKFYRQHNFYDFPQKQRCRMILMYLVGGLMSSPSVKSKMGTKMYDGMLAPYKKVIDKS